MTTWCTIEINPLTMVVLTEEMLMARTKQSNLAAITKLNCWGNQLSDVSILRRMTNVVVLSLSVNCINTLVDFQFCKKLQDLFIRKNNIQDLNEVVYLKDLEQLKHLWLGENPCASVDGYRLAVIRALPHLKKLDDDEVENSEVQKALKQGRVLIHPDQIGEYYSDPEEEYEPEYNQDPQDNSSTIEESPSVEQPRNSYSPEPNTQYHREREYVPNNTNNETEHNYNEISSKHVEPLSDLDYRFKYEEKQPEIPQRPSQQIGVIHRSRTLQHESYPAGQLLPADLRNRPSSSYSKSLAVRAVQPNVQSDPEFGCSNEWKRRSCQSTCCIQGSQKRLNDRRTNVLNAVLCLVKELDYPNLEVVEMAVKCRMEELAEM